MNEGEIRQVIPIMPCKDKAHKGWEGRSPRLEFHSPLEVDMFLQECR